MKNKQCVKWQDIIFYILFLIYILALLSQKVNLHVDEVFTYGLANNVYNNTLSVSVEDGIRYEDAATPWLQYMAVEEGHRFDYANVWLNQEMDVHPPLYYVLIHTISSLFPGEYSIWYAGIINIVFAILTLWIMRKLIYEMTNDTFPVNVASMFFICSAGVLDAIAFLRMYIMTLFLVTLIVYLFIKEVNGKYPVRFWITIGVLSVVGALTHYYFIVYLFYLCLVLGLYFLLSRKWKAILCFITTMTISGVLSVALFPAMIDHMFGSGQRGQQSINNLKKSSLADYWSRLTQFYDFLNDQIFGGVLSYIIVILFLGILIDWLTEDHAKHSKKNKYSKEQMVRWILLILPGMLYFITVSKMAVYITERYQHPIYAVVIVGVILLMYAGIKKMTAKRYQFVLVLVLAIMTVNGWRTAPWANLQKASEPILEIAEENAELDCIYVYDARWKMQTSFYDVAKYNSATFYKENNLALFGSSECKNNAELIVYITNSCNHQGVLDNLIANCPSISASEKLGSWGYTTVYRLYG